MTSLIRRKDPGQAWETEVDSGGSVSSAVIVETFHVTSPEILDLNNNGVEITSTPDAGKMIAPIMSAFKFNPVTTPYTLPVDPTLYVSTIEEWVNQSNQGYWYQSANLNLLAFLFSTVCRNTAGVDDVSVAGGNGQALAIFSQGPLAAFTDGDGTLDITTSYVLIDV